MDGMIYKRKKKKPDGSVIEQKNWWIKYYKDGKPYFESAKTDDRDKAEKLLARRVVEIEDGKTPTVVADRARYEKLMADLEKHYRINDKNSCLEDLKDRRVHLDPFFKGLRLSRIDTRKIVAYVEHRKSQTSEKTGKPYANATINRELAKLSTMFTIARKNGLTFQPPLIEKLKEAPPRKGFYRLEEFERLRDALPEYLRPVLTFANATGWRKGEILNLTWDRVNLLEGTIRLECGETKNEAARNLYLEPELKEMFEDLWEKHDPECPYVFQNKGRKIGGKTNDISHHWEKVRAKLGMEGKLVHDFRRTGVSNMRKAGISEKVCMQVSGHKTRGIFERYNIVDEEDMKEAAEKRAAYHAKQKAARVKVVNFPGKKAVGQNPMASVTMSVTKKCYSSLIQCNLAQRTY